MGWLGRLRSRSGEGAPAALAIGAGALACALALQWLGVLQPAEMLVYDAFVRTHAPSLKPTPRIALVVATEADLERYDWPVSDELVASLLESVLRQRPRAVALDLYRDRPRAPGTERLAGLLRASDNVYAVIKFEDKGARPIAPPPALADKPNRIGFADVVEDSDGVVRRGLLYLDDGKSNYASLGMQVALRYLAAEGIRPAPGDPDPAHIRLGGTTIAPLEPDFGAYVRADAAGYQVVLDFAGGRSPFTLYTFAAALENRIPADALRDRIVLIGIAAQSVKDFFATPFRVGEGAVEPFYGVALHAHTASQVVRIAKGESRPMRAAGGAVEALWVLAWALAGALLSLRRRGPAGFALLAAAGVTALLALGYALHLASWWLPLVSPVLAYLLASATVVAYLTRYETAQREMLMRVFSRYVSKPLAAEIWQRRAELLEGGRLRPRRLTASVLFSDVKGFTSISEQLDPQRLMDWLSEYLGSMAELVHQHGGIVDKFIGDSVMAVFGLHAASDAPEEASRAAADAVACALRMAEKLTRLNEQWSARGLTPIGIRIGIHTGPLAYGTVGSAERVESTVIGDTVNIASRLESFDKDLVDPDQPESSTRILISEDTLARLGGNYRLWPAGEVILKGKQKPVRIYGVRGAHAERSE